MAENTCDSQVNVLVVEDEVLIAADLEARLRRLGHTVCGKATTGEMALGMAEQHKPDLVLMDIVLRGEMDGIEAAELVRDKYGIPVIFISAYADTDRFERAKLAYPFGYILKPFQDRDLKVTIEMALFVSRVDAERRREEARLAASLQLNRMTENSLREIIGYAQEQACNLTNSKLGCINSVEENEEKITQLSWSNLSISPSDFLPESNGYDFSQNNIWREVIQQRRPIIINDYKKNGTEQNGMREVGLDISRLMLIPVFDKGKIIMLAAVGNKDCDYNENDMHQVSLFMEVLWKQLQRKKTEEALRISEERYRSIFENAMEGIFQSTPEGRFLSANPALAKMCGYESPEELIETITDISKQYYVDSNDRRRFMETIQEKGSIENFEFRVRKKDGSEIWISNNARAIYGVSGRIEVYEGMAVDITMRKKAEERLKESESFIRAVMNHLPIGVAVNSVDPSVDFTYINDNFLKFYRTTKEKLLGADAFWDVVYEDPEFREKIKDRVLRDCASGDPERMQWKDVPITRRGEATTYVSAGNIPVPGAQLMISTVVDTTDRKLAELARDEAMEQIRLRTRELEALFDGARLILEERDIVAAAGKIFKAACKMTGARSGYLALLSRGGTENEILFSETDGRPCPIDTDLPVPIRGLREKAYRTGTTVCENDFINSPWTSFLPEGHVYLGNVLLVPLNLSGRTIGLMGLANKSVDFNKNDIRMAEAFGHLAALSLRNKLEQKRADQW